MAVLTVYFMADLPRLRRGAVLLFPRAHRAQGGRIADVLIDKVGAYMIGNMVVSLVAGLAAFAALTGLGVPFAVPLAFVVAVCDLIPMIGATLGAVICVLVALLVTSMWPDTVLVAAFFVLYQQLENYLIAPRVMRGAVKLSPAAVLLAALIGGAALGLIGALMAIPVAAGVTVLLSEHSVPAMRPTLILPVKYPGVVHTGLHTAYTNGRSVKIRGRTFTRGASWTLEQAACTGGGVDGHGRVAQARGPRRPARHEPGGPRNETIDAASRTAQWLASCCRAASPCQASVRCSCPK